MRSYAPFVSILLSVLCAQAASTAAPTASRMKTILVLGDSLSEGFELKSSEAYLLEGVAGNPSLNLPDGIHPNAAGQKILAENVWRVLEPVARETAAEASSRVR